MHKIIITGPAAIAMIPTRFATLFPSSWRRVDGDGAQLHYPFRTVWIKGREMKALYPGWKYVYDAGIGYWF